MKATYQKGLIFTFITCLMISILSFSYPNYASAAELEVEAEAAILIDAKTGKILYEKKADDLLPPASMTKMMTEYLVLEAIDEGRINWEQEVEISEFVERISKPRDLSNVPLRRDTLYTVRELYEAMAIYSANGTTIALAELIAGSETKFVEMMNKKAEELSLENYKFVNSTGLNNSDLMGNHPKGTGENEENLLSAKATAKLAYHLINDFPDVLEVSSIPKKWFREGTKDAIQMPNWNWMLPGLIYEYPGIDGLKTGSTELAGSCFTGTAERNGMRLISVVMRTDSRQARFAETKKIMDYGFNNFSEQQLFEANYQIEEQSTLPVQKGKENTVEVATSQPLTSVIANGEKDLYEPTYMFDDSVFNEDEALTAPIEKGQKVGYMTVNYTGEKDFGYITEDGASLLNVDLVTTSSVEKANTFVLIMRSIGGFFADIWTSVTESVQGIFS